MYELGAVPEYSINTTCDEILGIGRRSCVIETTTHEAINYLREHTDNVVDINIKEIKEDKCGHLTLFEVYILPEIQYKRYFSNYCDAENDAIETACYYIKNLLNKTDTGVAQQLIK